MSKCSCESCDRPVLYIGMCSMHYQRYRRTGSTVLGPKASVPISERFWAKVEKRNADECWRWFGKIGNHGYGMITKEGVPRLAHRVSYEIENGPIPDGGGYHGMVVMHTCDNRACVNPAHLKLGTQADNLRDMDAKGRRVHNPNRGEKHHNAIFTDAQRAAIIADHRGHTLVAREYGTSASLIHYIRKAAGKDTSTYKANDPKARKGKDNPHAKLTEDDIRAIRASTELPRFVAPLYGIIPDYVTMIRSRKVWKHVE